MMKNKIAIRLTLYFSAALLIFSLVIGGVFFTLFRAHTVELQKTEMEKRAVTIAETVSELLNDWGYGTGSGMGMMNSGHAGYMSYLRYIDDIAMSEVWIVDENLDLLTGNHMMTGSFNYGDLPADAETVVKKVFQGETAFTEGFSGLMDAPTLTVGTPIMLNGAVIGALLLHSPVDGMNSAVTQGFETLAISVAIALILAVLLSAWMAVSFTGPLKKMKDSTMRLAEGDYSAKTGVSQKDEIGELASAIDVLSRRLDLASQESENLLKLRNDFVANISHELRTPVTVIRGSLEALCDGVVEDPVKVRDYHKQMLNESISLQRLVNDLLDLSRLQNLDFKLEFKEINLFDILDDAFRSARHIATKKNIDIQFEYEEDSKSISIRGDYGRLRQMMMIILDNAVKFSAENSAVRVILKNKQISIIDNGPGIAAEDIPYIFDRFYKTKSEDNMTGTGLGLSIAKQIAERHNVRITARSDCNETEFRLEF